MTGSGTAAVGGSLFLSPTSHFPSGLGAPPAESSYAGCQAQPGTVVDDFPLLAPVPIQQGTGGAPGLGAGAPGS